MRPEEFGLDIQIRHQAWHLPYASGRQEAFYPCEGPPSYRPEVFEDAGGRPLAGS